MVRKQARAQVRKRSRRKQFPFRPLVTVVVLILGAIAIAQIRNASVSHIKANRVGSEVGMLAPDFELNDLTGKPVKLSDFRGRPVVLTFMRTECHPCSTSAGEFRTAYEMYRSRGLVVLSVSQREREGAVGRFVNHNQLDYPFVLDPTGAVGEQYDLLKIPTTFFISPEGIIQAMVLGVVYRPWIEESLMATAKQ